MPSGFQPPYGTRALELDFEDHNLERRFEKKMQTMRESIINEVTSELKGFREHAVTPLEVELRDSLQNGLHPLVRHTERYDRDTVKFEERVGKLEIAAQQNHATLVQMSGDLAAEQRDHAEAINNCMDMLEKTTVHEDLERVVDQQTQEMMVQFQECRAFTEDLSVKLAALDERTKCMGDDMQTNMITKDKINELEENINRALEMQRQENMAETKAVERQVNLTAESLTASMTNLSELVGNRWHESKGDYEQLMGKFENFGHEFRAHTEHVQRLGVTVEAIDTKLESTSQVLDQKVELTAEEMDRQLAAATISLDTKLTKLRRELDDQADATEKMTLSEIRAMGTSTDSKIGKLQQKVDVHETLLHSRSSNELKELRDQIKQDTNAMRGVIDTRIHDAGQRVDQKLETALKQVGVLAINFKSSVATVEQKIAKVAFVLQEQNTETQTKMAESKKEFHDEIEATRTELRGGLDMKATQITNDMTLAKQESHSAAKRLESNLANDTELLTTRVETQLEKIGKDYSALDRKFVEKLLIQDATITDHWQNFAGLCAGQEQRSNDQNAAVNARLDDVSNTATTHQTSLNSMCTNLEAKSSDRMRHQDGQLESARNFFAEANSKMDAKISEQSQRSSDLIQDRVATLGEQILATRTQFNERCSQLDSWFSERGADFEEKLRAKQQAQDGRIDTITTAVQAADNKIARMDGSVIQCEASIKANREHFDKLCSVMESRFEERAALQDKVAEEERSGISMQSTHCQSLFTELDEKRKNMQQEVQQISRSLTQFEEKSADMYEKLDAAVKDDHRQLTNVSSQLQAKVAEMRADSDAKLQAQHQNILDLSRNLDQKHDQDHYLADGRIKDQHQLITDTLAHVENQSKLKDAEHDKRFGDITAMVIEKAQESSDMNRKIERQFVERDSWYSDKFTELTNTMRDNKRELMDHTAGLTKTCTEQWRAQADEAVEKTNAAQRTCASLVQKSEKFDVAFNARCDELQSTINSNQEHALETSSKKHVMQSAMVDEVEQKLRDELATLKDQVAAGSKQATDTSRLLSRSLKEETENLQEKLRLLAYTVNAHDLKAVGGIDGLASRLKSSVGGLENQVEKQQEMLSAAVKRVEDAQVVRSDGQDQKAESQDQQFAQLVADLTEHVDAVMIRNTERMDELDATTLAQHIEHTQQAARMVDLVKEENESQDRRVAEAFSALEDVCSTLDANMLARGEAADHQAQELRHSMDSLDLRLTEKDASQDERTDELGDAVEDLRRQQQAVGTELRSQLSELTKATTKRAKWMEASLAAGATAEIGIARAEVELALANSVAELNAAMERHTQSLADMVTHEAGTRQTTGDDLSRRLDRGLQVAQKNADRVELASNAGLGQAAKSLADSHRKLGAQLADAEAGLAEELGVLGKQVAGTDVKLDKLDTEVTVRVSGTIADLTTKVEGQSAAMERVDEASMVLGIKLTTAEHKLDEVCGVDGQLCEIGRSLDAAHDAIEAMEAAGGGGGGGAVAGANVAAVLDARLADVQAEAALEAAAMHTQFEHVEAVLAELAILVDAHGVSDSTAMSAADAAPADGSVQAPGGGD
jgi:hypothetical protein